jgi:release factor glutamine methyltransferase
VIPQLLKDATEILRRSGIQDPLREAEWLLANLLGISRGELYLQQGIVVPTQEWQKKIELRSQRVPLAYILGSVPFLDCMISVSPDVLIPRPETELLADKIIQELEGKDLERKVLFDVCTGSGCLAIALKKHLPDLTVIASDISNKALAKAQENAQNNGVQISFLQGDLLAPFFQKADFVVSNPPYIAKKEFLDLEPEVKKEPIGALVSGPTGLEMYQRLARELPDYLNVPAKIWLEIGSDQGEEIQKIFNGGRVEKDYSLHDRFFSLEFQ